MQKLLNTLVNLGDVTSRNLKFAYDSDGEIRYGEIAITETNLLNLKRSHPNQVKIETFTASEESNKTGADWDWHIIGKHYTVRMRVQAKRVYKNNRIEFDPNPYQPKGGKVSPPKIRQQRLLIESATKMNHLPMYCIYSSEDSRNFWNAGPVKELNLNEPVEFGCLLANACDVKYVKPKKLCEIEYLSFPWHVLYGNEEKKRSYLLKDHSKSPETMATFRNVLYNLGLKKRETILALNNPNFTPKFEVGYIDTNTYFYSQDKIESQHQESGAPILIKMDIRQRDKID